MIILGCVSVYDVIVVRSFMESNISEKLFDAASIDGCGQGTFFAKVVLGATWLACFAFLLI